MVASDEWSGACVRNMLKEGRGIPWPSTNHQPLASPAARHLLQRRLRCLPRLRHRIQRQALLVVRFRLIQLAQLPCRLRESQPRIRVISHNGHRILRPQVRAPEVPIVLIERRHLQVLIEPLRRALHRHRRRSSAGPRLLRHALIILIRGRRWLVRIRARIPRPARTRATRRPRTPRILESTRSRRLHTARTRRRARRTRRRRPLRTISRIRKLLRRICRSLLRTGRIPRRRRRLPGIRLLRSLRISGVRKLLRRIRRHRLILRCRTVARRVPLPITALGGRTRAVHIRLRRCRPALRRLVPLRRILLARRRLRTHHPRAQPHHTHRPPQLPHTSIRRQSLLASANFVPRPPLSSILYPLPSTLYPLQSYTPNP